MFLFILLVAAAAATTDQEAFNNATQRWISSVDEVLTMISIGPLKDELTPAYIGKRTAEAALSAQCARFRSRVARSLIETIGTKATSCIDPSMTSDDAVQVVHDELIKHEFTVAWVKSSPLCPTVGGRSASALVIDIPPPAAPVDSKK